MPIGTTQCALNGRLLAYHITIIKNIEIEVRNILQAIVPYKGINKKSKCFNVNHSIFKFDCTYIIPFSLDL